MLGIIISLLAVLATLGFVFNSDNRRGRANHEWLELLRDSTERASSKPLPAGRNRSHRRHKLCF